MPHQLPLDPRKPGQLGPTAAQALSQAQQNPQATGGILPLQAPTPPSPVRQTPATGPLPQQVQQQGVTTQPQQGGADQTQLQPTRADMIRQFIPQFKDNPIAAIGFVLQSLSAGLQGRPSPSSEAIRQAQRQQQINLQRAQIASGAMLEGLELASKVPLADREQFAKAYGARFEQSVPGFTQDFIDFISASGVGRGDLVQGVTNQNLRGIFESFPSVFGLGTMAEKLEMFARNRDFFIDETVRLNRPGAIVKVSEALRFTNEALVNLGIQQETVDKLPRGPEGPDGEPGALKLSLTEFKFLMSRLPEEDRLTAGEMAAIEFDEGLLTELGLTLTGTAGASRLKREEILAESVTDVDKAINSAFRAIRSGAGPDIVGAQISGLIKAAGMGKLQGLNLRRDELQSRLQGLAPQQQEPLRDQIKLLDEQIRGERIRVGPQPLLQLQNALRLTPEGPEKTQIQAAIDKMIAPTVGLTEFDIYSKVSLAELVTQNKANIQVKTDAIEVVNSLAEPINATSALKIRIDNLAVSDSSAGIPVTIKRELGNLLGALMGTAAQTRFQDIIGQILGNEGSTEALEALRSEAKILIAQSVPVITGETSGRITDKELGLSAAFVALLDPTASPVRAQEAISNLMLAQLLRRQNAEITVGKGVTLGIGTDFILSEGSRDPTGAVVFEPTKEIDAIFDKAVKGEKLSEKETEFLTKFAQVTQRLEALGIREAGPNATEREIELADAKIFHAISLLQRMELIRAGKL